MTFFIMPATQKLKLFYTNMSILYPSVVGFPPGLGRSPCSGGRDVLPFPPESLCRSFAVPTGQAHRSAREVGGRCCRCPRCLPGTRRPQERKGAARGPERLCCEHRRRRRPPAFPPSGWADAAAWLVVAPRTHTRSPRGSRAARPAGHASSPPGARPLGRRSGPSPQTLGLVHTPEALLQIGSPWKQPGGPPFSWPAPPPPSPCSLDRSDPSLGFPHSADATSQPRFWEQPCDTRESPTHLPPTAALPKEDS